MVNSWDAYYQRFTDWDEAHSFNVQIKPEFEKDLIDLGYSLFIENTEKYTYTHSTDSSSEIHRGKYIKNSKSIKLSYDAPYDWSIDSDWEDKALELLGLKEEWVVDSIVEDI
tara:strand:- start:680 stop:1015 length:336 start_codon:yes stop_codon:yes gene_type:complete